MLPEARFLKQSKRFWANVRLIGQKLGYTIRRTGAIKVPDLEEICNCYKKLGLQSAQLATATNKATPFGQVLLDYLAFRADRLNSYVEPRLMDLRRAKELFESLRSTLKPACPLPMNKQTGSKKTPAFLTCIVNMLIQQNAGGMSVDYDPRELTILTRDGEPIRTLARRIDGAFPSTSNPVAVWQVKEYYHTTTFGSRVADAVYETLLDGMEIEEAAEHEGIRVKHYLMVDAHYTWWQCGRSYLCRIMDLLHMGYLDEVLFGYEVVERLPGIVREWVALARRTK